MSWHPCESPESSDTAPGASVQTIVVPRSRDLGGFEVRRVLPSTQCRTVGPFVFLDQLGPTVFASGKGIDVRPHPHIGLATVTYLLQGTIVHRDSLGSVQPIRPGDVNWMTAGRGIVHSERSDEEIRKRPEDVYGLQLWVALPERHEEIDPDFTHYAEATLPVLEEEKFRARVIAGSAFERTSPVKTLSELFFADAVLEADAQLAVDTMHEERGAYLLEGSVEIDGTLFAPGRQCQSKSP